MKKTKLLLSLLGLGGVVAIATPFIVSCSSSTPKQDQTPQIRKRYYARLASGAYWVQLQEYKGLDNYFNEVWENVGNGTYINLRDWEAFVQKANNANIEVVIYEN